MTHPLLQTVAGSGNTVSAMLLLSAGNGTVKVGDHLPTQTRHAGDGQTLTSANGMRGSGRVSATNGTDCSAATMLRIAGEGLTLTGTLAAEAGDGDGHRLVSVAWLL